MRPWAQRSGQIIQTGTVFVSLAPGRDISRDRKHHPDFLDNLLAEMPFPTKAISSTAAPGLLCRYADATASRAALALIVVAANASSQLFLAEEYSTRALCGWRFCARRQVPFDPTYGRACRGAARWQIIQGRG